jgi:hypothetical protein
MSKDNYGYFGPEYSFADNIPLPGEIGVRNESSIGAIVDAVGGINHYVDIIAFGERTFMDTRDQRPMGIRYFLNTDMKCSNGATMSDYMDGITKGDIVGTRIQAGLASAGLPGLRGLAPGIMENARDALDPRPLFAAVTGTGYPVCQKVACGVGDANGSVGSFLVDPVEYIDGYPTQTRWVQAYDAKGNAISVTGDEFASQPKCYDADGTYKERPPDGCPQTEQNGRSGLGSGKYNMCYLIQSPTLPPTLEGFDKSMNTIESTGLLVLLVSIGICVFLVLNK